MREDNSRANETLRGSVSVASDDGMMNTTQKSFIIVSIFISKCNVSVLLTHASLVNAISAGQIMLVMHQVAAML
jgi:hypothetical protein